MVPGCNKTDGKKKSFSIMFSNAYLKPALVQCAHAAATSNKSFYYVRKYKYLVRRHGKKELLSLSPNDSYCCLQDAVYW